MDWLERVAEIRKICNVPAPARNVAIARVWVDETFLELFAFSGKLLREGAVGLPNQPMFQTFDIWWTPKRLRLGVQNIRSHSRKIYK